MKLAELKPDTRNANKGTDRGRKMIQKSLKSYGAGRSILIDRNGHIIAGNKTAEGAKAAGLEDVQVVQTDGSRLVAVQRTDLDINDKAARELAIADNRASEVSLEWDPNVLADFEKELSLEAFWSPTELEQLLAEVRGEKEVPEPQLDKAAELQQKWGTARGQIWEVGKHRLMCGDARVDAPVLLGGTTVPCMVTSPPYGVGLHYASYNDTLENCRELIGALADLCAAHLVAGGFAVVNFGDILRQNVGTGTDQPCEYPMGLEYWPAFRAKDFVLWARRIWVKYMAPGLVGPWTASTNRAAANWEHVWTWKKVGKAHVGHSDRSQWAVIDWRTFEGEDSKIEHHPGYFPAWFANYLISIHSVAGDVVLEPFLGTGSTMVAAEQLGRICYGLEIEPKYVAVSLQRLADMGLKPVKVHG